MRDILQLYKYMSTTFSTHFLANSIKRTNLLRRNYIFLLQDLNYNGSEIFLVCIQETFLDKIDQQKVTSKSFLI